MEGKSQYLVTPDWLASHLDDDDVRVVDCTTHLPALPDLSIYEIVSGRSDFETGHIPGALFVDLEPELSAPGSKFYFALPSPDSFAAVMGRMGIGDDTHVVCYHTANHWWATRLWWMLRVFGHDAVSVLDGGFHAWKREGRPVEAGPCRVYQHKRFTPRYCAELVATKQDVLTAIGDERTCIVNALRPEQHAGTGGMHFRRPGRIAGSVNIPVGQHVRPDAAFKPESELRELFRQALAKERVIAYCGSGIAATSVVFALAALGHDNARVYDNSMMEWAADPSLPMETG